VTLPWKGSMAHIVGSFWMYPENTSAVTLYYPTLEKQTALDEQQLRSLLEQAGDVYL
jgi:TfoX/Sxy family transcriptional regulator of competence genes